MADPFPKPASRADGTAKERMGSDNVQLLPLDGVKVLDFTRVLSGPWATMSLADLGAEVWKIESVAHGDDSRAWSVPNYKGVSTYYLCANRGKHSLALDLKTPEGQQVARDLAANADVVVENFRPDTAPRLGIGYEDLSGIRPDLIYCSISGYGQNSHERDRPGYDFIMQAESGLMSITGETDGPPNRFGVAITDIVAGMIATQSILAALFERQRTGKGQYIDVSLLTASLNLLANIGTAHLNAGVEPERFGNAHPTVVPYQTFETRDGLLALAVGNDRMFIDFCNHVIGRQDLADDHRFGTAHQRALHRDALVPQISDILATRNCEDWLVLCHRASVPAGKIKTVAEALQNPGIGHRGAIQNLEHPSLGEVRLICPAHGLDAQANQRPKAPPLLGEDSLRILREVLNYGDHHIEALVAGRVVRCA
jgi:crotonobetainyl-CoA:carnitine CoA-transferase CaiB-like acyl-CoA transferase